MIKKCDANFECMADFDNIYLKHNETTHSKACTGLYYDYLFQLFYLLFYCKSGGIALPFSHVPDYVVLFLFFGVLFCMTKAFFHMFILQCEIITFFIHPLTHF